jgi:hypothetical protein
VAPVVLEKAAAHPVGVVLQVEVVLQKVAALLSAVPLLEARKNAAVHLVDTQICVN